MSAVQSLPRKLNRWFPINVSLLAAAATGFATGWPTGQAGLDSVVLAAVLPAVLTGVAGGAGAILLKRVGSTFDTQERVLVSVVAGIVMSFSVFFVVGTVVGVVANDKAKIREANEAVRFQVDTMTQRYEYLTRCTDRLVRLNEIRQQANARNPLEPLTINQVCIALDATTSLDHPLVSLLEDTEILRLSRETEKKHYEYLERCTVNQARVNAERKNRRIESLTIDQVCPALGSI